MFKKLLPFFVVLFVTACAHSPSSTSSAGMNMSCCQKCECAKSGKCGECCKGGKCTCAHGCEMCKGKKQDKAAKGDEECPACAESERKWKAKHGKQ